MSRDGVGETELLLGSLPHDRFFQLWRRFAKDGEPEDVFQRLLTAYNEPHRAYHNAAHIADCLDRFDAAKQFAIRSDEVEVAIWFHDVVYQPRARDNENQSAAWASRELQGGGCSVDVIDRVASMIEATKHDVLPAHRDCELLVDIDLSILGRDAATFDNYDRAIRREYDWVPAETYRVARMSILRGFLERPRIFRTAWFYDQYEAQARLNLNRLLDAMSPIELAAHKTDDRDQKSRH